jgi:hypothetical protein
MRDRRWWGLLGIVAVGMGAGLFHGAVTAAVATDPYQPSPGMAAGAPLFLGVFIAIIVIPVLSAAIYRDSFRDSSLAGPVGYLLLVGAGAVGWIVGFLLTGNAAL